MQSVYGYQTLPVFDPPKRLSSRCGWIVAALTIAVVAIALGLIAVIDPGLFSAFASLFHSSSSSSDVVAGTPTSPFYGHVSSTGSGNGNPSTASVRTSSSPPFSAGTEGYVLSTNNILQQFHGLGTLDSGAQGRFLIDYPEPQRSQILDYLFLPRYGASLHFVKLEIGGDTQGSTGTEPSYRHTATETPDITRGYWWWVAQQAQLRNPKVKIYMLAWGWPGWLGSEPTHNWNAGDPDPGLTYLTVQYVVEFIQLAKSVHGLTIDYVGIWNESPWSLDYIVTLSAALKAAGLSTVVSVADNGDWRICDQLAVNSTVVDAVSIVGAHYSVQHVQPDCQNLGLSIFDLEDNYFYSCLPHFVGQNYVRANITGSVVWSMLASFYPEMWQPLPGIITAISPWSGNYIVTRSISMIAHFGQFADGDGNWYYLNPGSGTLSGGGAYVALVNPSAQQFTLILDMVPSQAVPGHNCNLGDFTEDWFYNVSSQMVSFYLDATIAGWVSELYVYQSNVLDASATFSDDLALNGTLHVVNGVFSFNPLHGYLYTISTLQGSISPLSALSEPIPPDSSIPSTYSDNFDNYVVAQEARYFADQAGSFEITPNGTMRQMVPSLPIGWWQCPSVVIPISVFGPRRSLPSTITASVLVETPGTSGWVAVVVTYGACQGTTTQAGSPALAFSINPGQAVSFNLWADTNMQNSLVAGSSNSIQFQLNTWYELTLSATPQFVTMSVNGVVLFNGTVAGVDLENLVGWSGIGSSWGYVQYDNVSIAASTNVVPGCAAGYLLEANGACQPASTFDQLILASAPSIYWPLADHSATYAQDLSGNSNYGTYVGGPFTFGESSLVGDGESAVSSSGVSGTMIYSAQPLPGPQTITLELWFSTTSTTGGQLVGFYSQQSSYASPMNDRMIFMTNSGSIVFAVYNNAYVELQTPGLYNDGMIHQVVAVQSPLGTFIYMDGSVVASCSNTQAQAFDGWFRVGGGVFAGWPSSSSSSSIAATYQKFACYLTALSATTIASHWAAK